MRVDKKMASSFSDDPEEECGEMKILQMLKGPKRRRDEGCGKLALRAAAISDDDVGGT